MVVKKESKDTHQPLAGSSFLHCPEATVREPCRRDGWCQSSRAPSPFTVSVHSGPETQTPTVYTVCPVLGSGDLLWSEYFQVCGSDASTAFNACPLSLYVDKL